MFHPINVDPSSGNFLTSRLDDALLNRVRELRSASFGFRNVLYQIEDRDYSEAETNLLVNLLIESVLPAKIEKESRAWKISDAHRMCTGISISVCSYKNASYDPDDFVGSGSMFRKTKDQRAGLPHPVNQLVAKLDELLDGSNWKVDFIGIACEFITLSITTVKEFHIYETDAEYEEQSKALCNSVMRRKR